MRFAARNRVIDVRIIPRHAADNNTGIAVHHADCGFDDAFASAKIVRPVEPVDDSLLWKLFQHRQATLVVRLAPETDDSRERVETKVVEHGST